MGVYYHFWKPSSTGIKIKDEYIHQNALLYVKNVTLPHSSDESCFL